MLNDPVLYRNWRERCVKGALAVERLMAGPDTSFAHLRVTRAMEFLRFVHLGYGVSSSARSIEELSARELMRCCGSLPDEIDLRWAISIGETLLAPTGRVEPAEVPRFLRTLSLFAIRLGDASKFGPNHRSA